MDAQQTLYYEILAAIETCKKKNYGKEPVIFAVDLIEKYVKQSTDCALNDELIQLASALADKYRKRAELENTYDGGGTHTECPFPQIAGERLAELQICKTSLLEANKIYRDNAQILISPFLSEATAILSTYAKQNSSALRIVDCERIRREFADNADALLKSVNNAIGAPIANEIIAFTNIEALADRTNIFKSICRFIRLVRLNRTGIRQYIVLTDPSFKFNDIYKECVQDLGEHETSDGLSDFSLDVMPVLYLTLPPFEQLKAYICRQFDVAADNESVIRYLRKDCFLLGYEGLSALIAQGTRDTWENVAYALINGKRDVFDAFAKKIGFNLERVLDREYEYRQNDIEGMDFDAQTWEPKFFVPATEYDSVEGIEQLRDGVLKILNRKDVSIRYRCSWVVHHAMVGDENMFNIINLDDENLETILKARWNIAYSALCQLMRIPRGELVFDIPSGEKFVGLCCDGGKTIRLLKQYMKSRDDRVIADGICTLLHECYHALQHAGVSALSDNNKDLLSYYMAHFHVSPSRIKEWATNFSRYRDDPFDIYYDQVVEAEARIFSAEVVHEFGMTNVPNLD